MREKERNDDEADDDYDGNDDADDDENYVDDALLIHRLSTLVTEYVHQKMFCS